MFLDIAKGKEELKTLITKERKKKTKKPIIILNMGRRFKGPIRTTLYFEAPPNEDDNQEEDVKSVKAEENNNQGSDEGEADYSDE